MHAVTHGLTADDFIGPPMGSPREHRIAHKASSRRAPNVTHKRRKTEELEVPSNLKDMEIPLEEMGDVIVLTGDCNTPRRPGGHAHPCKRGDRGRARCRTRSSRHPAAAVLVGVGHALPPPCVQRTLCPTNTIRLDRIFLGHNYMLDTGGGGTPKRNPQPALSLTHDPPALCTLDGHLVELRSKK